MTYEYTWYPKYNFSGCKTYDDLIAALESEIEFFKAMKAENVELDAEDGAWFFLRTENTELANKYNFEEQEQFCENCEECQCDCNCENDETEEIIE